MSGKILTPKSSFRIYISSPLSPLGYWAGATATALGVDEESRAERTYRGSMCIADVNDEA